MSNGKWTAENIPNLAGKAVLITGGNSGLGFEMAKQVARKGAHVVIACRNQQKANAALEEIRKFAPESIAEVMELDLSSLESIRKFVAVFRGKFSQLHVLCNNAGVMALPYRKTADGFEMQIGTNHLGHFALTAMLLDPLLATAGARIVNVSSNAHKLGKMNFDDLQGEKRYKKWGAYGQSKLANLLFTYELHRRLEAAGKSQIAVAAHPGYASTNLQTAGPKMEGSSFMERLSALGNRLLAQGAAEGAWPQLYAATVDGVRGGEYYGPDGPGEMWGHPKKAQSNVRSRDEHSQRKLWEVSEKLTGVKFAL